MRKLLKIFFLAFIASLSAQDCDHSRERTQNTLVPDIKLSFIPQKVTENSAVAFLAEGGRRNLRFNGSFGLLFSCENRCKVSGEYLQQKLGYNYETGNAKRWVRQFALGAAYEQDFCNTYIPSAEISGYCSYAPSRNLSRKSCNDVSYAPRIAGSTGYGFEIGSTMSLWPCAYFFLDVNFDAINFHRRSHSNKRVQGFGGSVGFHQQFALSASFDLRAEFRRPFNYYRASLSWVHPQCTGITIGIFGSHTRGKYQLPSNTMAGIELSYVFFDLFCPELVNWVAKPAIYMPEVLANRD